jgi:hypothetical protein
LSAIKIRFKLHFSEEFQQAHGIDVEYRRCLAVIAGDRIIARQRQDVAKAFAGQHPAAALLRVAVPVLAG